MFTSSYWLISRGSCCRCSGSCCRCCCGCCCGCCCCCCCGWFFCCCWSCFLTVFQVDLKFVFFSKNTSSKLKIWIFFWLKSFQSPCFGKSSTGRKGIQNVKEIKGKISQVKPSISTSNFVTKYYYHYLRRRLGIKIVTSWWFYKALYLFMFSCQNRKYQSVGVPQTSRRYYDVIWISNLRQLLDVLRLIEYPH